MFHDPHQRYIAALTMLDLFASVNVTHFDITKITLDDKKSGYYSNAPIDELKRRTPATLDAADKAQNNIIIRPRHVSPFLIQLDDLDRTKLSKLASIAFMMIETSPDNYQAWVAVETASDVNPKEISSRLRKGTDADKNASGAVRLAGSLNFKHKYAPDFPAIAIHHQEPALIVSVEQLESLHLLAPLQTWVQKVASPTPPMPSHIKAFPSTSLKRYPSYARCLQDAPPSKDGNRPDTSHADFVWCMIAADWGFSVEQIASQLLQERDIAHNPSRNKPDYAMVTARNASQMAEKNRERRR